MLSIIIPTYNEEKYLPKLLKSIKEQSFKDYEIIISDADSKDKTLQIAKKFKCKITKGGFPARGRNNGAKKAKDSLLLFLDADTILKKNSLKDIIQEFKKRKLDIAGINQTPLNGKKIDYIIYGIYNFFQRKSHLFDPYIIGHFILIKKDVFKKLKGFNENLVVSEDHALARKAKKQGYKTGILNNYLLFNTRRLDKEGRTKYVLKMLFFGFRRIFGEIEKSKLKYDLRYRK